jgi:hypothetical protein
MKGTDGKYHVRVMQGRRKVLYFDMDQVEEPSNEEVAEELKNQV